MLSKKLRLAMAAIALFLTVGAAAPSRAFSEVSFEFFHSSLVSHGSWHVSASFGQVWQPYVEVRNWHPYSYGHWVYTDFGWTWVSDYHWGAIPFHYGTWVIEPGLGWVWVPGYVWAPAWVVYRTGPSYIGWAPVPPSFSIGVSFHDYDYYEPDYFVFVPERRFCDRNVHRYALPYERTRVVYNETRIINNITIDNDVIVNRGIDVDRIERVSARRPDRLSIDRVPRVAPFERVSRERLQADPREALRVDPRRVESSGRVRVVTDDARSPREARRRERSLDTGRTERARDRGREPQIIQPVRRERREPVDRRDDPSAQIERERVERDQPREERQRAVERDRARAVQQDRERGRREQEQREPQRARQGEDMQQQRASEEQRDRQERARAAQIEQQRAADQARERMTRRNEELEQRARQDEARERREQDRARERADRVDQQRAAQQQERAMRQQQERAEREQQRAHEQQRAREQERARQDEQRARQSQDEERARANQADRGPQDNPNRRGGRDRG